MDYSPKQGIPNSLKKLGKPDDIVLRCLTHQIFVVYK